MIGEYAITIDDLTARLTARTLAAVTDDTSGRTVDEEITAEKVLDAEASFHSYAGVYYVTPIAASSPDFRLAKKVVIDLAAWELLSRRPHAVAGEVGDVERTRYDATLAWLRGLAGRDRRVQLTGSAERVVTSPPSGGAEVISDESRFAGDGLADY